MIPGEQTICYKISQLIEDCEKVISDQPVDIIRHAKLLHEIRASAQKMEDGLKRRKKMMSEAKLEYDYQKQKGKDLTPPGINEIANTQKEVDKDFRLEIIVKEDHKIVYQNKVHAGTISVVEKIDDIDDEGAISGVTQKFVFGSPLAVWYAFNQLEHEMEGRKISILMAIKEAILNMKNPVAKQRLLDVANNKI